MYCFEQHWDILSSEFFAFLSNRAMLDVKCYARRPFRLACLFKTCNHVGVVVHYSHGMAFVLIRLDSNSGAR